MSPLTGVFSYWNFKERCMALSIASPENLFMSTIYSIPLPRLLTLFGFRCVLVILEFFPLCSKILSILLVGELPDFQLLLNDNKFLDQKGFLDGSFTWGGPEQFRVHGS